MYVRGAAKYLKTNRHRHAGRQGRKRGKGGQTREYVSKTLYMYDTYILYTLESFSVHSSIIGHVACAMV